MQQQPSYNFRSALITNRRPGTCTPMVGAPHLHTFGACSDHLKTNKGRGFCPVLLHGFGPCADSMGNKCGRSFLRTRSQIPGDKKDQKQLFRALLLVRLAPKQPAIRITAAMDFKDG